MSRIKDLLLRLQNEQDQPNPNEIKLSFNDQWFLLTTMLDSLNIQNILLIENEINKII